MPAVHVLTGLAHAEQEVLTQGGHVTPGHVTRGLAHLLPGHLGLHQELLRVESVEGPEVVGDGQQLGEDGGVVRVLRCQDALED